MTTVTIFRFQTWDTANDEMFTSRRWGTREAIERLRGILIEGTGVETDASNVGGEYPGLTAIDFDPQREPGTGFQTVVQ